MKTRRGKAEGCFENEAEIRGPWGRQRYYIARWNMDTIWYSGSRHIPASSCTPESSLHLPITLPRHPDIMPRLNTGSTHHCPKRTLGNCRKHDHLNYCATHQTRCKEHTRMIHLITEPCPTCEMQVQFCALHQVPYPHLGSCSRCDVEKRSCPRDNHKCHYTRPKRVGTASSTRRFARGMPTWYTQTRISANGAWRWTCATSFLTGPAGTPTTYRAATFTSGGAISTGKCTKECTRRPWPVGVRLDI